MFTDSIFGFPVNSIFFTLEAARPNRVIIVSGNNPRIHPSFAVHHYISWNRATGGFFKPRYSTVIPLH